MTGRMTLASDPALPFHWSVACALGQQDMIPLSSLVHRVFLVSVDLAMSFLAPALQNMAVV